MKRLMLAGLLLALSGCAMAVDQDSVKVALSEHQRDSVLALQTAIPNASVVGRALQMEKRVERRNEKVNAEAGKAADQNSGD
ncbi:MAG: hypothetical protein HOP12_12070 [Candidatus Eisenbacteria bacterium]|uniref:Secreted protein n=1 Tax=Eiseniibacteriota bacterium TaxID=2212470 RepID=A0A849SKB4_UNCEI|nr:hypothetical protein [Candidatus Eisenbacteria bacterium]